MAQALAQKFEQTGPAEKERVAPVAQREQLASTPEPSLPKGEETEPSLPKGEETEPSVPSTRSQGERESR